MSTKKTLLFFSLFLLVAIPFYFFVIVIPINMFEQKYNQAPAIVNDFINETYPVNFIINIKNGEVSINETAPYCLIVDNKSKTGILFDENVNPTNFLNENSSTYLSLCNPVVLVGKNFVVYPDTESDINGSYKIQKIPSDVNLTITRDMITKISTDYLPMVLNFGKKAYYIGPFILSFFTLLSFLSNNLWYAIIAKLFMKLTKIDKEISFKKTYSKTFFVLFIYTVFNWVIVQLVIVNLLHINFYLKFPFSTTIIVVTATLLLEKFHFKKNQITPPESSTDEVLMPISTTSTL